MAQDEVIIRLTGTSQQLEAQLRRIESSLQRIGTTATATQSQVTQGAQRSSAAINKQNQSFTLMVAKLALVTFAVQTLANIFQNTFGAILKNIDDFQVAAIGAAAAITSITASNAPAAEVFNQNLQATKDTFTELEIVAAKFFSTGQELQLAFNTLAQRGVVVRKEELNLLGQITDQIKLLTGGQNSEIQIQQELRAILDGNVRTTTALGKQLQARGVNIVQLSREIQATGSLKPLEGFLTGLDAAGPAIQRTLSSVLATFSSLFSILGRGIFQKEFDGVVDILTDVNNFIIDNRTQLIATGQIIVEKIKGGFDLVLGVVQTISNILGDLSTTSLGQLLILIKAISLLGSGPAKSLGILAALAFQLTGSMEGATTAINIFFKAFRLGLKVITDTFDALTNLDKLFNNFKLTLIGFDNISLLGKESALEKQIAQLSPEQLNSSRGQRLQKQLDDVRQQIIGNVAGLESEINKQATNAGESVGESFSDGLLRTLKETEAAIDSKLVEFGVTSGTEKIKAAFDDLVKQAKDLQSKKPVDFVPTQQPVFSDTRIEEAQNRGDRQVQDANLNALNALREQSFNQEVARIKLLQQQREVSGKAAFDSELDLKNKLAEADINQLKQQIELAKQRADQDLDIIRRNLEATQGATKIQQQEAAVATITRIAEKETEILQLNNKIGQIQRNNDRLRVEASNQIVQNQREVQRLLENRTLDNRTFGRGSTNQETAVRANLQQDRSISDFVANNPSATAADKALFEAQAKLEKLNTLISTQLTAFVSAVDTAFNALIDSIFTGSFEFRDVAANIGKDLIKAGLEDFINQTKKVVTDGLKNMFSGFSDVAAQQAAQALALGIGLLLAVLSKVGNEGDFTATGSGGAGSSISSSAQTRGLIGGQSSLPIAEINNGLQEALIPTNSILSQIERNTRGLSELSAGGNVNIQDLFNQQLTQFFNQQLLNT